jgi:excisionase family DNA binding protein
MQASTFVAPDLLKVAEVAQLLRIHPTSVYRLVERGDLHAVRIGESGPIRIRRGELDRFLGEDET